MEGCGLREDFEAPVGEGRTLLFFQGEGLSDQVSQGHGRIVERGLGPEGSVWRALGQGSLGEFLPPTDPRAGPGQGAVGTEGLWQGAPSGPGTHPARAEEFF